MELVIDQNIIFEDTGGRYLILYNMQTKKWNKFFQFQFQEKELYYRITGIQVRGDDLYVQGTVCDSRINDFGGSQVVTWILGVLMTRSVRLLRGTHIFVPAC